MPRPVALWAVGAGDSNRMMHQNFEPMWYQKVSIPLYIVMVLTISGRFKRRRRQSGPPVTPRDQLLLAACNWALGWLWLGLPSLLDWGGTCPGPR
jgi:hypothetical protein